MNPGPINVSFQQLSVFIRRQALLERLPFAAGKIHIMQKCCLNWA